MDKVKALAQLRQSRVVYERAVERQAAERRVKLHRFLDQHTHASQWATSLAALDDAVRHGVAPSDAALCRAIQQCGQRGQLPSAARVYEDMYRRLGRPRPLAAHVAFMGACADSGNFAAAHRQFRALRDRDVRQHVKNASHRPVVNDDLTTEYLRAALRASVGRPRAPPPPATPQQDGAELRSGGTSSPAPDGADGAKSGDRDGEGAATAPPAETGSPTAPAWQVALEDFVALRQDAAVFRGSNELTPLLLEMAVQLACVGRQWQLCLAILRGADAEQALTPPEAYDAAIRACYGAQRHAEVVRLMERLIATRVPPDERSVRLALTSSEEVSAHERAQQLISSPSAETVTTGGSSSSGGRGGAGRGWAMALTLFSALERNGFPLYQQSYEAPLRACVNAGRWREALDMVETMRRDHRPISAAVYALTLSARIEAATTWSEVRRLMDTSSLAEGHASVVVLYLAALRACMRQRDWKHFAQLNKEMRDREIPETYDKMRLLIEAAYLQEQYHSVLMRFARLENITQYERQRVVQDKLVRLYEEDFDLSPALLDMVLDAYTKVKGTGDAMVEAAYQAALRHKERCSGGAQSLAGRHTAPDAWMYSQAAREARAPPTFH
ncbi:Pentatricopeptide repeat domain containing protein [Novymonas esmeraldas]|uniref:Pentatricopeptide repeat domain containing protein n=1 Tax=Novymonas esmeraldas TaxID=1808958 RepID=A0AAW0F4K8_9TRYP